jgi:hypothetical protein
LTKPVSIGFAPISNPTGHLGLISKPKTNYCRL